MIPAVIYARYSSSNQREESIAGQLRDCRQYAERNGLVVIEEYTDSAMTATSDRRPSFQRMIKDAEKHTFQVVLVWKLDRFARDRYDAAFYRKQLRENGAKLISVMEPIADGPEGIILEGMLEAMAEYYSANLSENIKRGTYDSAIQRKVIGTMPLGYKKGADGRYEVDPATAPIVRRIFQEYTSGRSRAQIIEGLNEDGIRTRHGKPFNKTGLYPILKNEKYIGIYRYKDIIDDSAIPALIDRETFQEAQRIMREKSFTKKRRDLPGDPYRLATRVYCGLCGSPMTGESATSRSGKIYRYYSCIQKKNGTCTKERVPQQWLEESVIRILNEKILTDEMIEQFVEAYRKQMNSFNKDTTADLYKSELADVERKISNTTRAIAGGFWSDSVRTMLSELEARRDELTMLIRREEQNHPVITPEMIREYFQELKARATSNGQTQDALIDLFLRRVYVWDPKEKGQPVKAVLEISLTGSDGEPVSFDVVLGSSENTSVEGSVQVSNTSILVCCTL